MSPYRVQIIGNEGSITVQTVMASSPKKALLCVIENLPEEHPLWNSPGWRDVQAFPRRDAFIIERTG
jgi:hypothetical protein